MSDDIVDQLLQFTEKAQAKAWEEGFKVGAGADTDTIVRILTTLTQELRVIHYPHPTEDPEDFPCCCKECHQAWPCSVEQQVKTAADALWDTNKNAVEVKGNQ